MEPSDTLLTLFSAEIELRDGQAVIELPTREVDLGAIAVGDTYRVAVLTGTVEQARPTSGTSTQDRGRPHVTSAPPVEEGELREFEIEDTGEKGDGIARVGPGYVVFVPETKVGDRVTVEITQVRDNFAFAEVVEPEPVTG